MSVEVVSNCPLALDCRSRPQPAILSVPSRRRYGRCLSPPLIYSESGGSSPFLYECYHSDKGSHEQQVSQWIASVSGKGEARPIRRELTLRESEDAPDSHCLRSSSPSPSVSDISAHLGDSDEEVHDDKHAGECQQSALSSLVGQAAADSAESLRKFSDPSTRIRRERIRYLHSRHRCLSDGGSLEEDQEECSSSALGCDSGYNDDRSKIHEGSTDTFASPVLSDAGFSSDNVAVRSKRLLGQDETGEDVLCNPLALSHKAKRSLTKHHSVSSNGGASSASLGASSESPSMNSLWEFQSPEDVLEMLYCLGFDDASSHQLLPERFIPKEPEVAVEAPALEPPSEAVPQSTPEYLPLGATAETFLKMPLCEDLTPPPSTPDCLPQSQFTPHGASVYSDPTLVQFNRSKLMLETVPEETASDLSPSPRWFSPRVSVDHSVDYMDLQEGKLGSALAQKQRKRSLPQREGYKLSIGSQVESEADSTSIYFSVTSYDDDITREREREREKEEHNLPLLPEEVGQQRRRRRGVYTPPPGLMSWLTAQPISEEDPDVDPDELPWPFSEQARLRKSLTEIHQSQQLSMDQCRGSLSSEPKPPEHSSGSSPLLEQETPTHTLGSSLSGSSQTEGSRDSCSIAVAIHS